MLEPRTHKINRLLLDRNLDDVSTEARYGLLAAECTLYGMPLVLVIAKLAVPTYKIDL